MRVIPVLLLGLLLGACTILGPSMTALSPTSSPSPASSPAPSVSPSPSGAVGEVDTCLPDAGPLPSGLQGDPCPSAIAAVRSVVAPLGLPVETIYIEPAPFACGPNLWPGIDTFPACAVRPFLRGTTMHGWASFLGSAKVAAVSLSRGVPERLATSAPTPPWQANLTAFEVPPAGWVMP